MVSYSDNSKLTEALKKGNSRAYEFLVDHYHHRLCVYAFGLTHNHSVAEDIVQNVFVRTWKQRHKLKSDFPIKNFLYKSVYNEFIDYYRKQKAVLALEKKYVETLNTFIEEEENLVEKWVALINHEIENLPPKCKKTFLLSKREGLTNLEIAEYLNISVKAVEAHITKAFSIIREKVGDKINGILFLLFAQSIYTNQHPEGKNVLGTEKNSSNLIPHRGFNSPIVLSG